MSFNRKKLVTMGLIISMLFAFVFIGLKMNVAPVSAQPTTLEIDPSTITVSPCDNFTVNVNVKEVQDLYAWQANVTFDPSLMQCVSVTEGPFLQSVGPTLWPAPIIDNVAGYAMFGCTLLMPPGASGSGTVAYITFHCEGPGSSLLHFEPPDTLLWDSELIEIPFEAIDGNVDQAVTLTGLHGLDGLFYGVHLHAEYLINLASPICTYWHELWPYYCSHKYHLNSWEDNGDNRLSPSDQIDMIDTETEEKTWWHVDDVTVTILVQSTEEPKPPMYLEFMGGFSGYGVALMNPIFTDWHEVYPVFSPKYYIGNWSDNGDGMLSYCDKIYLIDSVTEIGTWYHIEQVATDIIVTRKPVSTHWHEIYPEFCSHRYHLSSWIDNGDHELSYCDKIDLTDEATGEVSWWHVESVTITMVVKEKFVPEPELIYMELYEEMPAAFNPVLTEPVCTIWHEIWPIFSRERHLSSWEDTNNDGWLSPSDQIDMTPINFPGNVSWYHVDDISIDIWIKPLLIPVHDIAVIDVAPQLTSVAQGQDLPINVTVENQGDYIETTAVTAYADPNPAVVGDEIKIGTEIVTLELVGTSGITIDMQTPQPVPPGTYTISAEADPVPGEVDTADNTFVDDKVTVLPYLYLHGEDGLFYSVHLHAEYLIDLSEPICTYWHELWPQYCNYYHLTSWEDNGDEVLSPSDQIDMTPQLTEADWNHFWSMGDVNKDGYINDIDVELMEAAYGSMPGDPNWNPDCDLNGDGIINVYDMVILVGNYGLDIWTYFGIEKSWWHVDDVTITIEWTWKTPPPGFDEPIPVYAEPEEPLEWPITNPIGTQWHMIYPWFCRPFRITSWEDTDGSGTFNPSDQFDITFLDDGTGPWWAHLDNVATDIIVTRKPICTQWHEIYPNLCKNSYHLSSWKDNGDHKLSPCDIIDLTDKNTGKVTWWHVVGVTLTMVVTEKNVPPPIEPMYLELHENKSIEDFPHVLTNPISNIWHEIWPVYCRYYHLSSWEDTNMDHRLSPSDQIDMTDENNEVHWYHIDDIMIDIWLEPVPMPCPPRIEWNHAFGPIDYFMTFCPSPGVADLIDDDPQLEIVTGTDEWHGWQKWHAFDHTGAYEWTLPTQVDESRTSVAIGDMNRDGHLEIAGGTTSGWETQVFDHTGSFVWRYSSDYYDWWHSSPAMCDVNPYKPGLEVIAAEYFSGKVFCFAQDGSILWTFQTQGIANDASPACADIDNDGEIEVVIGEAPQSGVPHYIYAIDGITGALEWRHWIQQPSTCSNRAVHSSAALADIDNDNRIEVIFGANDGGVRCLRGTDGSLKWVFWTAGSVYSSPAVGDVDADGDLEIIVGSNDQNVYCLSAVFGVPVLEWRYLTGGAVVSSAALANRGGVGLAIYIGSKDARLYAIDGFGALIWSFHTGATNGITSSPAVADIDGDRKLEVMFTDWNAIPDDPATTNVFWVLEDCTSTCPAYAIEWAMFRHDRCHTGKYSSGIIGMSTASETNTGENPIEPLVLDHDVAIVFDWLSKSFITAGETVDVYVTVENQGTNPETTAVTVTYDGTFIGSAPVTLDPGEEQTLTFPWDTTGVPKGAYLVTADASVVPGETDTIDNTFSTLAIVKDPVHDIAIASVVPSKTILCQGRSMKIKITIFNQGDYPETFGVTASYGVKSIGSILGVTLGPSEATTITLVWHTAVDTPKGDYTIGAYIVTPILGETDLADNTLADGIVTVVHPGDLNNDKVVDIADVVLVTAVYRSRCGDPNYRPNSDIIEDCIIDIADVVAVTSHYREIDP